MKTIRTSVFLFFSGLILALLIFACMQQLSESVRDANGDTNLGFETIKEGLPVNWLVYTEHTTSVDTRCRISADSVIVKEGKYALCFDVDACSDKGGRYSPGMAQELVAVPGSEYTISVWIKSEGAKYRFSCYGVNALHRSEGLNITHEGTQDWKQYTMRYKLPRDRDRIKLELSVLSVGRVWVDGIEVQKIP